MKGHVLISPLDWGLGHATRSTVLAGWLLDHGFQVSVAGDDFSLQVFQETHGSKVGYIEGIPNYQVTYNPKGVAASLFRQLPNFWQTARAEHEWISKLAPKLHLTGILSDNRFGLHHEEIYSVYMTHQIKVQAYGFEALAKTVHERVIRQFDACWIPDFPGENGLSGALSSGADGGSQYTYIGWLNRLEGIESKPPEKQWKILVLGSGPEPARTEFIDQIADIIQHIPGDHLILEGKPGAIRQSVEGKVHRYSHASAEALKGHLESADYIITRPGYTSLMELTGMNTKLILVPTPGQTEQVYLSKRLDKLKRGFRIRQRSLSLETIKEGMQANRNFLPAKAISLNKAELFKPMEG